MPVLSATIDGVDTFLVMTFVCLAVIAIQFFCCWKWDHPLIWLIPTVVNIILIIVFFFLFVNSPDETALWERLDLFHYSLIALGADLVGWGTWLLWNYVRNGSSSNPAGY